MMEGNSIYELFLKGGAVMWPIGIAGILALAILLERLYALRKARIIPERLVNTVADLAKKRQYSEAGVLCEQDTSGVSIILRTAFLNVGKSRERLKELMEETGKSVVANLERYVNAIGTIAAVSPLMGLLGTVTGMIRVFQKVTTEGVGDPRVLASGIWEALLTTAAGLIVAIPAYIAYRYLMGRVDRLVLEMEETSLFIVDKIDEGKRAADKGESEDQ